MIGVVEVAHVGSAADGGPHTATSGTEAQAVAQAWASTASPPTTGEAGSNTTLVEGTSFCISDSTGDVHAGGVQGLYVLDTRVLSRFTLRVGGHAPEPLDTQGSSPFARAFVGRRRPGDDQSESRVLVVRHRELDVGLWERLTLRNVSHDHVRTTVELRVEADFADLFAVKEIRTDPAREVHVQTSDGTLVFTHGAGEHARSLTVSASDAHATRSGTLTWTVDLPARGTWSTCVRVAPALAGRELPMPSDCGESTHPGTPGGRLAEWRRRAPRVSSPDENLTRLIQRSVDDLGSLRIFDPEHPENVVVAAGAPWFMALFGRDALLTAWMLLPVAPSLAVGTLLTLARFQGTTVDPATEEEPGRILHEIRFGAEAAIALGGRNIYYGSVDSTPLFVMLVGELARWGAAGPHLAELLVHADAALGWIAEYGDRDGDGFVEYQRATDRGLVNQGWKDSADGVTFSDGQVARAPIALAEVQAYVYAAYLARAELARDAGDTPTQELWTGRAADLKTAFNERFWLADRGYYAMGLDADKRPIDGLGSNMGHCLWTGIVDTDRARSVADHLMGPEMFTGFGIRTLASTMPAYNPMSYHNGSVWPHDTAIAAAGLMRYGFVAAAQRLAVALVSASAHFDGAMPELFCGFDAGDFAQPVPYPTACHPQAWAAAAPLSLLRTLLRLDPDVCAGHIWFDPAVPRQFMPLQALGLHLADQEVTAEATHDWAHLEGAPARLKILSRPRPLADPTPRSRQE